MSDNEKIITEKTYEGYIKSMSAEKDNRWTVLHMTIYTDDPQVILNMKYVKVITRVDI